MNFDCVIMLTFSDWFTEMYSNRYHYATRFSASREVFFFQVNGKGSEPIFKKTDNPHVTVVEIQSAEDIISFQDAMRAIWKIGYKKPIFWVYNPYFSTILKLLPNPQIVYHATEDYFCEDFIDNRKLRKHVGEIVQLSFLVVTVSEGVADNIKKNVLSAPEIMIASNGCDFDSWSKYQNTPKKRKVVYQGGIHRKIDISILEQSLQENPDVEFVFLGEVSEPLPGWEELSRFQNFSYLGKKPLDELIKEVSECSIGLIPFIQNDWIINRSMPLKFYEYLSAGLQVVSVPIRSLPESLYYSADNKEDFSKKIKLILDGQDNSIDIETRINAAKSEDYDPKFNSIIIKINQLPLKSKSNINGIIIVDTDALENQVVQQSVSEIMKLADASWKILDIRLLKTFSGGEFNFIDLLIIHYSVRLFGSYWSKRSFENLKEFAGLKIMLIQDEYDHFLEVRQKLKFINFSYVLTCVPEAQIELAYPKSEFPNTKFIPVMTGYITSILLALARESISLETRRDIDVFYRGRVLPLIYGSLGFEKWFIGTEFKKFAADKKILVDIEVEDEYRIYGQEWYNRLRRSKTMLGTESGSNLFDIDNNLEKLIHSLNQQQLSYHEKVLRLSEKYEGFIQMNQISPKVFEMFACGCVPILFEGQYSSLIAPDKNYIPLKKDFSNFNEVVEKIKNDTLLSEIRTTNYNFILSRKELHSDTFTRDTFRPLIERELLFFQNSKSLDSSIKAHETLIDYSVKAIAIRRVKRLIVLSVKFILGVLSRVFRFDSDKIYRKLKGSIESP